MLSASRFTKHRKGGENVYSNYGLVFHLLQAFGCTATGVKEKYINAALCGR